MENGDAVDDAAFGFISRLAEFLQPLLQGLLELRLFFLQFFLDLGFILDQFRISAFVLVNEGLRLSGCRPAGRCSGRNAPPGG